MGADAGGWLIAVKLDFWVLDGVGCCCPDVLREIRTALAVCLGLAMGKGVTSRYREGIGSGGMVFS